MSLAAYFMMTMRGSIALWWQVAVGLAFVAHLISVLRRVPPDPGPMARSADWSYTLYVMHYPLLLFAYGTGLPMLPSASAVLILVVVIGRRIEQIKIIKPAALAPKNSLA